MASEIKWGAPASSATVINGDGTAPTLKGLANGGQKCGMPIDNAAGKHRYADYELLIRGASAFSAGGYVELYHLYSHDGTTFADGADDSTAPPATALVGIFPLRAVSSQQRICLNGIPILPFKFHPVVIQRGGQSTTSTDGENLLKSRSYNEEIQ